MTRLTVDILNPKAPQLLKELANLGLIAIRDSSEVESKEDVSLSDIDYSRFNFPVEALKFDRDEINDRG